MIRMKFGLFLLAKLKKNIALIVSLWHVFECSTFTSLYIQRFLHFNPI